MKDVQNEFILRQIDERIKNVHDNTPLVLGQIDERIKNVHNNTLFVPMLDRPLQDGNTPFMQHSTCNASDFTHPRYFEICKMLQGPPVWHRKQWEWVGASASWGS